MISKYNFKNLYKSVEDLLIFYLIKRRKNEFRKKEIEGTFKELLSIIEEIQNKDLRLVAIKIFEDNKEKIKINNKENFSKLEKLMYPAKRYVSEKKQYGMYDGMKVNNNECQLYRRQGNIYSIQL